MKKFKNSIYDMLKASIYPIKYEINEYFSKSNNRLINFIICGVQRGGTSGLYSYLNKHPQIYMGIDDQGGDEPKYFDKVKYYENKYYSKNYPDYRNYHKYFQNNSSDKIIGSNGPVYSYLHDVPKRIWFYNPNIKLILILRNPVDRAFSQWNMESNAGRETKDFFQAILSEQDRARETLPHQHRVFTYIDRGYYVEQIRRISRFFPKDQLLVIKTEDLRNNTLETVNKVCTFLNIKSFDTIESKIVNPEPYRKSIRKNEKEYLLNIYEHEINNLERILDWDCSSWVSG